MAQDNRNQNQTRDGGNAESRSERESLKQREYRGPNGEIHHHTHTYMEQHGEKGRNSNNNDRKTR